MRVTLRALSDQTLAVLSSAPVTPTSPTMASTEHGTSASVLVSLKSGVAHAVASLLPSARPSSSSSSSPGGQEGARSRPSANVLKSSRVRPPAVSDSSRA